VSLSLGDRTVGSGTTLVVAEIGSNHDGDLERALALIDAAAAAGADAVQFHSFRAARAGVVPDRLLDRAAADAQAHRARVELRTEWYARLRERASARGLVFLATPFDEERATLLAALGVPAFPVAAYDLERTALLRAVGGFGRPVLLGVAGAGRDAIDGALVAIGEGAGAPPRRPPVVLVTGPNGGDGAALHGVGRLDERYACLVGWSDRQATPVLALGAVARGACLVVKPFTDDRARRGPEHANALDPAAFAAMVAAIRELEPALGEPRARRSPLPAGRHSVERVGRMR
jgi:N,N'-diacetyllegionaminate synthase